MVNKSIKNIWLVCLWLTCLCLAGCFHIPDEDWLPSKWKIQDNKDKEDELIEAVNDLIEWVNIASSQRNEMKNNDEDKVSGEELDVTGDIQEETVFDELIDWETENIDSKE